MNILRLLKWPNTRPDAGPKPEPERFEATLSGSGGQGIVLAGKILAEAAALYDGKEAIMTQSYGPEARGGASKAQVIISRKKIGYPNTLHVDLLLAMTQEAINKHGKLLAPEGLLIADETFVKEIPPYFNNVFKAPFTSMAMKLFNTPLVSNIIALGSLAAITGVISRQALIRSVTSRVPDKVLVVNRVAVDSGFKIAEESGFKYNKKG